MQGSVAPTSPSARGARLVTHTPTRSPSSTRIAATRVVVLSCLALACGPDLDLVERPGEYVDYLHSRSLRVCGGTHAYVDGFVPFVAAELGLEVPGRQAYYWLDAEDYEKSLCDQNRVGCAGEGHGVALDPSYLHELVHGVALSSGLPYQPFFGEGLAVAFDPWNGANLGPRYVVSLTPDRLPDPRPLMTRANEEIHYYTAGSFVLFLLARHGAERFVAMTRELGEARDMAVIRRVFRAVYDAELDDEAELFSSGAACTDQTFAVGLYDCTMPEVGWGDGRWSFQGVMDCDREDVVGGLGPGETRWASLRSVTLEVPSAGTYRFEARGRGEFAAQMGPCFGCPWDLRDVGISVGDARSVELEAGTYFMRIRAESEASPEFELTLTPE